MRGEARLDRLRDKKGKLKSPNWYIIFNDAGRDRRISTGCRAGAQDHEAQLVLAQFILERERPTAREPGKLMVAQALKDYWEEHAMHTVSAKVAIFYERRVKSFFGTMFVSQVIPAKVNEYVRQCQKRSESNGTIRRDLEHLRAAFNHEIANGRLTHFHKIKLPDAPAPRERTLTRAEIKKLLSECKSEHVRNSIVLMLNTGQRPNAISSLVWSQVNFTTGIIHFEKTGKQRTNKQARPVPMNNEVRELLKRLHKVRQTEYVIEYVQRNNDGEVVRVMPGGNIKKAFERATKRAKLENVCRYTLRHTFANGLQADDKTRSDIMGHTNTTTTQTHYIKTNARKQLTALNKLQFTQVSRKTRKTGK